MNARVSHAKGPHAAGPGDSRLGLASWRGSAGMAAIADQRRFLDLFLAEQDLLRAYIRAVTGDGRSADELFQEVSGVLWEAFARYDQGKPFRPWALGVARLEILKWRQRQARRREVFSDEVLSQLTAAATGIEDDAHEHRLAHCLERLSAPARELLHRRYQDDVPIPDLASMTGRTIAAIEMALVRTRRALRACLEQDGLDPGGGP